MGGAGSAGGGGGESAAAGAGVRPVVLPKGAEKLSEQEIAEVAGEERFDEDLRRRYPVVYWATLIGPVVVTAGIVVALWATAGWAFVLKLLGFALATFFGLGRFAIAAPVEFMEPWQIFLMVSYMDLLAGCVFIFHAGFLYKIPKLGPALAMARRDGEFILARSEWMRRYTFWGLVAFVVFPLAATGSVGGSIFGRLLGLSRTATALAIVLGTLIGNGVMLVAAEAIQSIPFFDPTNIWNKVLGFGLIFAIIVFMTWRYNAMKRRWAAEGSGPGATPKV